MGMRGGCHEAADRSASWQTDGQCDTVQLAGSIEMLASI
jgi:hypothetical protein